MSPVALLISFSHSMSWAPKAQERASITHEHYWCRLSTWLSVGTSSPTLDSPSHLLARDSCGLTSTQQCFVPSARTMMPLGCSHCQSHAIMRSSILTSHHADVASPTFLSCTVTGVASVLCKSPLVYVIWPSPCVATMHVLFGFVSTNCTPP